MSEAEERAWQERLGVVPTNLPGFYEFPRPEAGFSTLSASPEELARYGVPLRPDADADPVAFRRWRGVYGRITEFVEPQLRERPPRRNAPRTGGSEADESGTATSGNWAGHVLVAGKGERFIGVGGTWVVPTPSEPQGGPFALGNPVAPLFDAWYSSAWVGLDGASNLPGVTSQDVFQAGTEHDLVYSGWINGFVRNWSMWIEWYPQLAAVVGGIPVGPGDLVNVELVIFAIGPSVSAGIANLMNVTRGTFAPVPMVGPGVKGVSFVGDSAEWIVETPGVGPTAQALVLQELPFLGIVGFFETYAIDSTGAKVSGDTGTTTTTISPNLSYESLENSGNGPGRTGIPNVGTVVAVTSENAFGVKCLF
jgi:Peptidase A4 family